MMSRQLNKLTALVCVMILSACGGGGGGNDGKSSSSASINNAPYSVSLLELSSVQKGGITASWQATDDTTPANKIKYAIHASQTKNFTPSASTLVLETTGETSAEIINKFEPGKEYSVMVVATDEDKKQSLSNYLDVKISSTLFEQKPNTTVVQLNGTVSQNAPQPNEQGDLTVDKEDTKPQQGQYITSEQNDGYLRKVKSVKPSNASGETVVETEQAAITDVIKELEVSSTFKMDLIAPNVSQTGLVQTHGSEIKFEKSKYTYNSSFAKIQNQPKSTPHQVGLINVLTNGDTVIKGVRFSYPEYLKVYLNKDGSLTVDEIYIKAKSVNGNKIKVVEESISTDHTELFELVKNGRIDKLNGLEFISRLRVKANSSYESDDAFEVDYNVKFKNGSICVGACDAKLPIKVFVLRQESSSDEEEKNFTVSGSASTRVKFDVNTNFNPKVNFSARVANEKIKDLSLTVDGNLFINQVLDVSAQAKGSVESKTLEIISPRKFKKIFVAGQVPIVVTGEMQLNAKLKGDISGVINAKQTLDYGIKNFSFGLEYVNGQFVPIKQQTPVYKLVVEGEGNAKAEIEVHLLPSIKFTTYGSASSYVVVDPYLNAKAGLQAKARITAQNSATDFLNKEFDADYRLTQAAIGGGLNLYVAADLKIWDKTIAQWPKCNSGVTDCGRLWGKNNLKLDLSGDALKNYKNFKKFVIIDDTPIVKLPTLKTPNVDKFAINPANTRWVKVSSQSSDYANPLRNVFGRLVPESYLPWSGWSQPRVAGAGNTVLSQASNKKLFLNLTHSKTEPNRQTLWINPQSVGEYIIRQGGYSRLGEWARQFEQTAITFADINPQNGILDYWDARYQITDPSADPDNDGKTNLEEFTLGTNPKVSDNNQPLGDAKATSVTQSTVNLSWGQVVNATTYAVYYSTKSFNANNLQGVNNVSVTGTETTLNDLEKGKKYHILIIAKDSNGNNVAVSNLIVAQLQPSVTPSKATKLNDTGITQCGTADGTSNTADCSTAVANATGSQVPLGQDGHYGTGKDGSKGMVFTKVAGYEGKCVQDEHTGLMWEVKQTAAGLHNKDNTYTWYNPDDNTNGGNAGTQNGGTCSGSNCDTHAFVNAVNAQGWCGYSDWRLPTREELRSIVDYSRYSPAIDKAYFQNTKSGVYWSSSPNASGHYNAWGVNFGYGNGSDNVKNGSYRARLVRAR